MWDWKITRSFFTNRNKSKVEILKFEYCNTILQPYFWDWLEIVWFLRDNNWLLAKKIFTAVYQRESVSSSIFFTFKFKMLRKISDEKVLKFFCILQIQIYVFKLAVLWRDWIYTSSKHVGVLHDTHSRLKKLLAISRNSGNPSWTTCYSTYFTVISATLTIIMTPTTNQSWKKFRQTHR